MNKSNTSNTTVVFDLDETLLHSFKDDNFKNILDNSMLFRRYFPLGKYPKAYSFYIGGEDFYGLYRPYGPEMLLAASEIFDNFIIWSAGDREYVEKIVRSYIINNLGIIPKLVLTRNHCEFNERLNTIHKPLALIKKYLPNVDLNQTIIIDDREENFIDNPDNSILIPPYEAEENDNYLLKLKKWFESDKVRNSSNYLKLDKTRIFL